MACQTHNARSVRRDTYSGEHGGYLVNFGGIEMKRSDLFREYARVIDMCESTDIEYCKCVRLHAEVMTSEPSFTAPYSEYTFAIGICEGKPVFAGDVLFSKLHGVQFTIREDDKWTTNKVLRNFTWTKPDPYAELKAAQKAGEVIQVNHATDGWVDCEHPNWSSDVDQYRIKPKPIIESNTHFVVERVRGKNRSGWVKCTWHDDELTSVDIFK